MRSVFLVISLILSLNISSRELNFAPGSKRIYGVNNVNQEANREGITFNFNLFKGELSDKTTPLQSKSFHALSVEGFASNNKRGLPETPFFFAGGGWKARRYKGRR